MHYRSTLGSQLVALFSRLHGEAVMPDVERKRKVDELEKQVQELREHKE